MDDVSATLQRTGLDLGKWDSQRPDRTLGDITEVASKSQGGEIETRTAHQVRVFHIIAGTRS